MGPTPDFLANDDVSVPKRRGHLIVYCFDLDRHKSLPTMVRRGLCTCRACEADVAGLEVPLGKGSAGAGLQIAFEADGGRFVSELDYDVKFPRSSQGGVCTATIVVARQAGADIGSETDIELRLTVGVLDYVNIPLGSGHAEQRASDLPTTRRTRTLAIRLNLRRMQQFPHWVGGQGGAVLAILSSPPSRLRRYGAASFACPRVAWFTEP